MIGKNSIAKLRKIILDAMQKILLNIPYRYREIVKIRKDFEL